MVEKPGQKPYAKWPTLLELHRHLFGTSPANLHNAIVDVLVCLRCFVSMHYNIVISEAEFATMIDLVMIEG
jgi:DNA polymerase III epsilon subunit-like protein